MFVVVESKFLQRNLLMVSRKPFHSKVSGRQVYFRAVSHYRSGDINFYTDRGGRMKR
jgi:hypothetical protein